MRIDKWLWAARFFKTRAFAVKACDLGRIECNGVQAKAAREVRVGDLLKIKNDAAEFEVDVLALSEVRGPAAVAQTLYSETAASQLDRQKVAAARKEMLDMGGVAASRPSKRDRQQLTRLRGR